MAHTQCAIEYTIQKRTAFTDEREPYKPNDSVYSIFSINPQYALKVEGTHIRGSHSAFLDAKIPGGEKYTVFI